MSRPASTLRTFVTSGPRRGPPPSRTEEVACRAQRSTATLLHRYRCLGENYLRQAALASGWRVDAHLAGPVADAVARRAAQRVDAPRHGERRDGAARRRVRRRAAICDEYARRVPRVRRPRPDRAPGGPGAGAAVPLGRGVVSSLSIDTGAASGAARTWAGWGDDLSRSQLDLADDLARAAARRRDADGGLERHRRRDRPLDHERVPRAGDRPRPGRRCVRRHAGARPGHVDATDAARRRPGHLDRRRLSGLDAARVRRPRRRPRRHVRRRGPVALPPHGRARRRSWPRARCSGRSPTPRRASRSATTNSRSCA